MDVFHIGLHFFYGIIRDVRVNLGAFMSRHMTACTEDTTKGLAYRRILTRIFDRFGMSFEGMVGVRPSEGDCIDRDCFKCLHLVYVGECWLYSRSKLKSVISPGYFQPNYIYNDIGGQEHRE